MPEPKKRKTASVYLVLQYQRKRFSLSPDDIGTLIGCTGAHYLRKESGEFSWTLTKECIPIRNAINKLRAKNGEAPMTIDELFFVEKVSKTTRDKGKTA